MRRAAALPPWMRQQRDSSSGFSSEKKEQVGSIQCTPRNERIGRKAMLFEKRTGYRGWEAHPEKWWSGDEADRTTGTTNSNSPSSFLRCLPRLTIRRLARDQFFNRDQRWDGYSRARLVEAAGEVQLCVVLVKKECCGRRMFSRM
jgi:hypothetical protein